MSKCFIRLQIKKMKIAVIVLKKIDLTNLVKNYPNADYFGIENGAISLAKTNLKFQAYGDFDSVSLDDLNLVKDKASNFIKLNPIKDVTDTEGLVHCIYSKYDKIIIYSAIQGKRIEHFLANLNILYKYNNVELLDENSKVEFFKIGQYYFDYLNYPYKYFSFFTYTIAEITLKKFKYELDSYMLKPFDSLGISNELGSLNEGELIIKQGNVIGFFSKDDHKKQN